MNKRVVSVQSPPDLLMAVHDLATDKEDTVSQVIEDFLAEYLMAKRGAKSHPPPTREKLVFALQKLKPAPTPHIATLALSRCSC